MLAEISEAGAPVGPPQEATAPEGSSEPVRMVGAIMVPHWREGLWVDVLPDVYRDIMEIVADATKPIQAKQIAPRIGLPAVMAKIEGRGES
ncbi:hypothetical protein [Streptomyces sp. DT9]